MIEGTAGLVVAFILLTLIVQVAGAAVARHAAEAAVSAAARRPPAPAPWSPPRRTIWPPTSPRPPRGHRRPGEHRPAAPGALATARFRWLPPGPDWLPLTIVVQGAAPRMVPP